MQISLGIVYFIWQLYLFGDVPDTVLSTLHIFSHLILMKILCGAIIIPFYTDEETKIQRG